MSSRYIRQSLIRIGAFQHSQHCEAPMRCAQNAASLFHRKPLSTLASDNDLYQNTIHPRLQGRTYDTCALPTRRHDGESAASSNLKEVISKGQRFQNNNNNNNNNNFDEPPEQSNLIVVVGGPASGKTILCDRLQQDCNVAHLCAGDLLQDEIASGTALGHEIASYQNRGEDVPGIIVLALIRRQLRMNPDRRVLLTGFPRNQQDAQDFTSILGRPELAISLECEDATLMERQLQRTDQKAPKDIDDAIQKLRTFRKQHKVTVSLLREQHVPIISLDSSGSESNVWNQLMGIGRLMRPAAASTSHHDEEDDDEPMHWLA